MTSYPESKWETTKKAGIACLACGKRGTCTVSPDRLAFKCWRDEGKVHHVDKPGGGDGTGYIGKAHAPAAKADKPGKVFQTEMEAIKHAGRSVKGGTFAGSWQYCRGGEPVATVARFNLPDGDKEFRPIHQTKRGWRVGDPPGLWPLYRGDELGAGVVWTCEGEKAADAAIVLGLNATTSAHGSGAADKTDWTPLAGRDVVILPDHDEPGAKYARDVAAILMRLDPPARVKVVDLPGLPPGGDVVEFVEAGGTRERIEQLAAGVTWMNPADVIGGPVLICAADIEPREVTWLWQDRIPLGRLSVLVGRPGEGKSFTTADMAARVTTGTPWPDGTVCPVGSVIIIAGEDDPADTIVPRLLAHRADLKRVHLLSMVKRPGENGKHREVLFTLADLAALEDALRQHRDCLLIVVDPFGSFIGGKTDTHRDNEVRSVLAPVAKLAEKYGPAVLLVAHGRKGKGPNADENVLGSVGIVGIARAVWHLSRDKQEHRRRLLLPGKNNLAEQRGGLAFTIAGEPPALCWERDPVAMTADDAMAVEMGGDDDRRPGPEPVKREQAAEWLADLLADGPMRVGNPKDPQPGTIAHEASAAGFKWATIRNAKDELRIKPYKGQFGDGWYWRLPPDGAGEPAHLRDDPPQYPGTVASSGEPKHLRDFDPAGGGGGTAGNAEPGEGAEDARVERVRGEI